MQVSAVIRERLRALPDRPGCYLMRDARGRIIYVGKAASLRKRVSSYFRDSTLRRGSPKLRSLVHSVADVEVVVTRTEAEAALTEGRLIKEYKPRYNVSFRDDKRFLLLAADHGAPVPRFRLCRLRRDGGMAYFGPFTSSTATRTALDFVEKHYGIRKCAPREPDAETYRHCLNDIIRFCLAPCVGRVTREAYRERFEEACAFLRGERPAVLRDLRERMREAAAAQDYERAAALRDTLEALVRVVRQRARVVTPPAVKREQAREGAAELGRLLGLPGPARVIEAFDISNIMGTYAVASMVCAVDGQPNRTRYRRFRIRTVQGADDPAMMAEVIRRRYRPERAAAVPPPDLVLVDGGLTQWRAARGELLACGLAGTAVAGLAKRFEELYVASGEQPLRLPADSQALRVLQRLRDEAHRFALDYHRRLRDRRIRESVLDDIEGIGPRRKEAILRTLGSMRRVLRATEQELAAVPGIGPELARQIRAALDGAAGEAPERRER